MSASIVRGHHLDVERTIAAVDVVLDAAHVWELDAPPVVALKLVLQRRSANFENVTIGPSIAVVAIAVPLP